MPSIWPFNRNRKKKLDLKDEKASQDHHANNVNPSSTLRSAFGSRKASKPSRLQKEQKSYDREKGDPGRLPPRGLVARAQTDFIPREPSEAIRYPAGARSKTIGPDYINSHTSSEREHPLTTQPSYEVPALRSKRSSGTSDILRSKSGRAKRNIQDRENEIKAFTAPIPIPRRPASFSSSPLARDSKRVAGGLDRRLHRPASEISLPMVESLRTSFSGDSGSGQYSYRVSAFDALSPRPTIRYSDRIGLPPVRERSSRSISKKGKGPAILEEPPNLRARVRDMADDLDAKGIRELLERDTRRRDRKKSLDAEKLQRKLQIKLEKQRAQEETMRRLTAPIELEATLVSTSNNIEHPIRTPDDEEEIFDTTGLVNRQEANTSDRWMRETSRDDLPMMNPFSDPPGTGLSSEQASIRDDAVIQSATAVRLSTISMSPPASPFLTREKTTSPPNLSSIIMTPQAEPPSSIPKSQYLQPQPRKDVEKTSSSWTSIFRRSGSKGKASADKGKEIITPEFSNLSRESFLRKSQSASPPVVQRSFKRETTQKRKQSKFREDLPELPISPPRSRMQSPELDRPLSPYVDDTRKLDDLNMNNNVTTSIEDVHPALRDQLSSTKPLPYQPLSPEPVLLSQSLASIDSEASWLSGRSPNRSPIPIESVRESQASLHQPLEERSEDQFDEPDFSRREFSNNLILGPGALTSQLRPTQSLPRNDIQQHPPFPHDETIKYDTVIGRRPNIIQKAPSMARSREGLLDEYTPQEEYSPVSPQSPGSDPESPTSRDSVIQRATSIKLGQKAGHVRQLSAGSARLLDIPARSSSDAKRASIISAASTARSPLASPRESAFSPTITGSEGFKNL